MRRRGGDEETWRLGDLETWRLGEGEHAKRVAGAKRKQRGRLGTREAGSWSEAEAILE
jgi:hypothetical protein